ncbi:MAG: hypothetical protein AB7K24_10165 [Gemmataceae bacterium]
MAQAWCPHCFAPAQIQPQERGLMRRCQKCGDLWTAFPGERPEVPTRAETSAQDLLDVDQPEPEQPLTSATRVILPGAALVLCGAIGVMIGIMGLVNSVRDQNPDALAIIFMVSGTACSGVVLKAGLQMCRLKSYRLALTGSILAMLPCCGPCFGLSAPIGLWALIMLRLPDVRGSFT